MITRKDLESAGYKSFRQSKTKQCTDIFFQKCICDDKGKKYYITLAEYDWRCEINIGREYSYEPDVKFETSKGVTFNTTMLHPQSIEEMHEFFEKLWISMGCHYYELYED